MQNYNPLERHFDTTVKHAQVIYLDKILKKSISEIADITDYAECTVKRYVKKLQDKGIEVLTLKDIDIKLEVVETGKNAIENSYLKAKAYYEATGIVSIGITVSKTFDTVSTFTSFSDVDLQEVTINNINVVVKSKQYRFI